MNCFPWIRENDNKKNVSDCILFVLKAKVPILAVIHGTSLDRAWKICQSGFATLSMIDKGFYGAGIYFTTYANYSLPYMKQMFISLLFSYLNHLEPAIIISFLLPGVMY